MTNRPSEKIIDEGAFTSSIAPAVEDLTGEKTHVVASEMFNAIHNPKTRAAEADAALKLDRESAK